MGNKLFFIPQLWNIKQKTINLLFKILEDINAKQANSNHKFTLKVKNITS